MIAMIFSSFLLIWLLGAVAYLYVYPLIKRLKRKHKYLVKATVKIVYKEKDEEQSRFPTKAILRWKGSAVKETYYFDSWTYKWMDTNGDYILEPDFSSSPIRLAIENAEKKIALDLAKQDRLTEELW